MRRDIITRISPLVNSIVPRRVPLRILTGRSGLCLVLEVSLGLEVGALTFCAVLSDTSRLYLIWLLWPCSIVTLKYFSNIIGSVM